MGNKMKKRKEHCQEASGASPGQWADWPKQKMAWWKGH